MPEGKACAIYDCVVNGKGLKDCGACSAAPCDIWRNTRDPKYSDEEFEAARRKYTHAAPFTKESLLYREIFEKYYPDQAEMVVDFWMPNKSWEGCDVNDPSARVLSNYGDSGK